MQAATGNNHLAAAAGDVTATAAPEATAAGAEQHWLGIQCNMIRGVSRGLLFRSSLASRSAWPVASWPQPLTVADDLTDKVLLAGQRDKTYVEECLDAVEQSGFLRLYQPLSMVGDSGDRFVVVLEMEWRDRTERRTVTKLLRWGSAWLQFALQRGAGVDAGAHESVFGTVFACLEQPNAGATAATLVSRLVERCNCQRVSLGLRKGKHMEVQALSHSARFKQEANLVQAIGAAMDEAADQDRSLVYCQAEPQSGTAITQAHAQLARLSHAGALCTVPLAEGGEIIGALTLERDGHPPFGEAEVGELEELAAMLGPVIALRYRDERSLPRKAWHSLQATTARLFGPEHIRLKLGALSVAVLLVFFYFTPGTWRVTADALVEGRVQRTIAAPIDGYIASAEARAGDLVSAGQQLGALEDSDLRLELLKWSTLRQQMISESREAMAKGDRAEVSIINARIEQADAELELLNEQLSRTVLLAPYDGIIIEGDLSQMLGTPVSRGDALFKVAPLADYRIILKVDEQDIAPVNSGQSGKLVLASMPTRKLEFAIDRVTPVSSAQDGRNFFRVEASLVDAQLQLQPGMEGVGKIEVGEANLFWLWTRDLANWIRLQAWTWWR